MPYVNVPNDLSKVKTKMALNLTKRQLICFGCAAAVGIPSYLLARGSIGNTGAMFLMTSTVLVKSVGVSPTKQKPERKSADSRSLTRLTVKSVRTLNRKSLRL